MYHIGKMIPNRIFFVKLFAYSNLRFLFAVRKVGAIAHPDSYREVEQWILNPKLPKSSYKKVITL